jgi:hypothetical protein
MPCSQNWRSATRANSVCSCETGLGGLTKGGWRRFAHLRPNVSWIRQERDVVASDDAATNSTRPSRCKSWSVWLCWSIVRTERIALRLATTSAKDTEPFADTAAIIDCLDLVITCDTAIGHCAHCRPHHQRTQGVYVFFGTAGVRAYATKGASNGSIRAVTSTRISAPRRHRSCLRTSPSSTLPWKARPSSHSTPPPAGKHGASRPPENRGALPWSEIARIC